MEAARILTESASALAGAIKAGELSSVDAVQAHIDRLRAVHPALNALIHDRYDAALADAAAADERILAARQAGEADQLPPFLGVPCTIKESFAFAGMPNSAGVVHRKQLRSTETAPPVQRLIGAGAIPLGVTNISELTLWMESNNHVYGRANNAYDPTRTAGGSSGGEGAVVGSGGSPFGLGSDIAGSIRIPAFFNGVFGHKPTQGLIPNTGQWPHAEGSTAEMLTAGPLARRAEDLMPLLRVLAGPDGVDPFARPAELGDPATVDVNGMTVLVSRSASYFPAKHELLIARERVAGALTAAGANVREVSLKNLRRALEYFLAALGNGGGESLLEMLTPKGGPAETVRGVWRERKTMHTWPTVWLTIGEALTKRVPSRISDRQIAAGRALGREFNDLLGDGILLHVPHSQVAPRHGSTELRPWAIQPTALFNVTNSPVTQVPLGLNDDGLPLGVQVVAARGNDHITIAVAQLLERDFGGWVPPFSTP